MIPRLLENLTALYRTKTVFTLDCPESRCDGNIQLEYQIRKPPKVNYWDQGGAAPPRPAILLYLNRLCEACQTFEKIHMWFIAANEIAFNILWYYEDDIEDDEITTWTFPASAAFVAKITN